MSRKNKVIADKWLNETTAVGGNIKRHLAKQRDSFTI